MTPECEVKSACFPSNSSREKSEQILTKFDTRVKLPLSDLKLAFTKQLWTIPKDLIAQKPNLRQ